MKTQIYYFSGTGNSLYVARELAQRLDGASIRAVTKDTEADLSAEAVGIVFPVHLWGAPEMVLRFLERLKADSAERYCFAVATYKLDAGDVVGQIKRKLQSCGIRLSAGFTIAMPGNNVAFYDTESSSSRETKFKACRIELDAIAEVLRSEKELLTPEAGLVDRFLKTGLLRSAVTRTFHDADKRFWVKSDCNGCGICARVCPAGNIKFGCNRPVWLHNCQQCMSCINLCPKEAIQSGQTTLRRGRYRNPNVEISDLYK